MLDKVLTDFFASKLPVRERRIGVYYPSELPFCLRKQFWRYVNPKHVTKSLQRVFAVGWVWHQLTYQALRSKKQIKVLSIEKEYKPKHPSAPGVTLLCTSDAEIEVGDKKFVVDIKSAASLAKITEPISEHVLQVTAYMYAAKIKRAILFYINKQTLATKEFPVDFNSANLALLFRRAEQLHVALKAKKIPRRVIAGGEWQCRNCEYKLECDTLK